VTDLLGVPSLAGGNVYRDGAVDFTMTQEKALRLYSFNQVRF